MVHRCCNCLGRHALNEFLSKELMDMEIESIVFQQWLFHWNSMQCTLHPVVIYYLGTNDIIEHCLFVYYLMIIIMIHVLFTKYRHRLFII